MHRPPLDAPEERVIPRLLRRQSEAHGDAPFLVTDEETRTFAEVDELADRCATGLRDLGVEIGDTVTLLMQGSPEMALATLGANRLGAVWVPVNPDYKGSWLRETIEESHSDVLVVDAELLPRVAELGELPLRHVVVRGAPTADVAGATLHDLDALTGAAAEHHDPELELSDTAAVLWTSGTTGRSKGVMQSHNAWLRATESMSDSAGVEEGDVFYSCLPLYNSAAWVSNVYPALLNGVPVAIDAHFSVHDFWDRTRRFGASHAFTLGAMHIFLWQAPPADDDADNPIRVFSAIPMPDALLRPFMERFGVERVLQGYGQSEMLGVCRRVDDATTSWTPNSCGRPIEGLDVRLLDDHDREVPVGEVGEFCVRPHDPFVLFNGYFRNPEATVAAWRNLWYHTGDLGIRNAEGEFFFFDRKADYIRYKGRNVSSFAVEAAVTAHPAVVQSAAYGIPSAELESESEIKVEVVLAPGAEVTPEELARFVNEHAPYFYVPRYIEVVDEVPQTPTGRVQKYRLRTERGVTEATWDAVAAGFEVTR